MFIRFGDLPPDGRSFNGASVDYYVIDCCLRPAPADVID